MIKIYLFLILALHGGRAGAEPGGLAQLKAEIEQALTAQLRGETVGISYAIAAANGESLAGAVGSRETTAAGLTVPMEAKDLLRVASISKLLTTVAVFQLIAQGNLKLGDRVSAVLPQLKMGDEFGVQPNWRDMCVRHLLTHTAGISRNVPLGDYTTGHFWPPPADYTQALAGVNSEYRPGEYFKYSNAGFMLLGRIVGQITQGDWELGCNDQVLRRILAPLGMSSSGFDYSKAELKRFAQALSFPLTHDVLADADWLPSLKRYIIPGYASVGGRACDDGLASSADDMVRFLAALLNPFYGHDSGLGIPQAMFWEMLTPQVKSGSRGQAFGFYWTNGEFFGHSGYYSGFRSVLSVFPREGYAIFLSRNSTEEEPSVAPIRSILRRHLTAPVLSAPAENFMNSKASGGAPILAPAAAPVAAVHYLSETQAKEITTRNFVSKVIGLAKPSAREVRPGRYELTFVTEGLGTIPLIYSGRPDLFYISGGSMAGEKLYIERSANGSIKSIFVNSYLRYHVF